MSGRPFIYVLAGVNGSGKSSVGGAHLREVGLDWLNPDELTKALVADGREPDEANGVAWALSRDMLAQAIEQGTSHAFETTLGGDTITALLLKACATHDVLVWYVGVAHVDINLQRIRTRVERGGHDIPAHKVVERFTKSPLNLALLVPHAKRIEILDNSQHIAPGRPVPGARRLVVIDSGTLVEPSTAEGVVTLPEWVHPILGGL